MKYATGLLCEEAWMLHEEDVEECIHVEDGVMVNQLTDSEIL